MATMNRQKKITYVSVRFKTARIVLWGSLGIFGTAFIFYAVLLIPLLLSPPDRPIQWGNFWSLLGMTVATVAGLYSIKKSLAVGMYLYIGGATLSLLVMILVDHFIFAGHELPFVIYGFHMGILALGLIVSFRAGLTYAALAAALLAWLGFVYNTPVRAYIAAVFALGMALPSLIVELLEKELRRTETKFSTLFQEALDVTLVVDETDGQILDANRATRAMLGYESRDLVAQPATLLFPPDAPLSLEGLLHSLQTQEAVFASQDFRRADGTLCPMDLTATRIPWEEGHAVLLTLRDITERKRTEEELGQYREHLEDLVVKRTTELTRVNAELQTSNQELNAYGHTVAHDLKNPLSTLIGFSDLLLFNYESMELDKRQSALSAIAQTGRKMINIVNELLLLASVRQADTVSVAPMDMEAIVKDALKRLGNLTETCQPDIVLPPQWPVVLGHAPWIEEAWVNYLSNAIKYGGRPAEHVPPRLELGYDILDAEVLISDSAPAPASLTNSDSPDPQSKIQNPKSKIKFWVRDNGKGLTPEEQAYLFTPFTRLSQVETKGHGLGLSIVRRIVEKCGGDVGVESVVGQGSTFYFTLPVAPMPQTAQTEKLFI